MLFHTGFHAPLAFVCVSALPLLLLQLFFFLFTLLSLNAKLNQSLQLGKDKNTCKNEGSFGCSNRKVPIKWWSYPNGWNHKAQQEMQGHHCSCDLHSFLDSNDCQLQLWFQPRKPTEVSNLKVSNFFFICVGAVSGVSAIAKLWFWMQGLTRGVLSLNGVLL